VFDGIVDRFNEAYLDLDCIDVFDLVIAKQGAHTVAQFRYEG
jgi:hypothetical protein